MTPRLILTLFGLAVCCVLVGCGGGPNEGALPSGEAALVGAQQAPGDPCSGIYPDPVNGTELELDCGARTAIFRFPGGDSGLLALNGSLRERGYGFQIAYRLGRQCLQAQGNGARPYCRALYRGPATGRMYRLVSRERRDLPPRYRITDLGSAQGGWSVARALNNLGQVVGGGFPAAGPSVAFLWTAPGPMQWLPLLPGADSGHAYAINDAGEVVGRGALPPLVQLRAFRWTAAAGTQELANDFGGTDSEAYGINNAGAIVGWAADATGANCAFLRPPGGPMQDLGTLGGNASEAYAINAPGQIVGRSETVPMGPRAAFLWSPPAGPMQNLGTLGGTASGANDLNDAAQVVGSARRAGGDPHAFLWTPPAGPMHDLGTLTGNYSYAFAINSPGWVVGYDWDAVWFSRAFLWTPGTGMLNLNDLLDPLDPASAGWLLRAAYDINDAGQICGEGTNPAGQWQAFLVTPVP